MIINYLRICYHLALIAASNLFVLALLSRRSSTSSEKKRGKSMTRSKSPFRSFRFKKPKAVDIDPDDLDDDDTLRTIGKNSGIKIWVKTGDGVWIMGILQSP